MSTRHNVSYVPLMSPLPFDRTYQRVQVEPLMALSKVEGLPFLWQNFHCDHVGYKVNGVRYSIFIIHYIVMVTQYNKMWIISELVDR